MYQINTIVDSATIATDLIEIVPWNTEFRMQESRSVEELFPACKQHISESL